MLDASALVALLADCGPEGEWVASAVQGSLLFAPHLALFEAANILRRLAAAGILESTQATLAHADLCSLPVELWPYHTLAERAWALRSNSTAYDASYIALAELVDASLLTLDQHLALIPGIRCPVIVPELS